MKGTVRRSDSSLMLLPPGTPHGHGHSGRPLSGSLPSLYPGSKGVMHRGSVQSQSLSQLDQRSNEKSRASMSRMSSASTNRDSIPSRQVRGASVTKPSTGPPWPINAHPNGPSQHVISSRKTNRTRGQHKMNQPTDSFPPPTRASSQPIPQIKSTPPTNPKSGNQHHNTFPGHQDEEHDHHREMETPNGEFYGPMTSDGKLPLNTLKEVIRVRNWIIQDVEALDREIGRMTMQSSLNR
ncbi:hypothetical protein HDU76_010317 [Blyttiomyces sp. JEL0837]|nr:hypothetical protein HDU76_010317 [Blyttiomyces sp. JEL0837]